MGPVRRRERRETEYGAAMRVCRPALRPTWRRVRLESRSVWAGLGRSYRMEGGLERPVVPSRRTG